MSKSNLRVALICVALTLIAALPRFYRLDALSFYADEDITALVARSVNEHHGARLPSGMQYIRALPYTWLTAESAQLFGADREAAYRLPSALLGTLTVPLFFLLATWLMGTRAAFVAGLLLAFSEWHLVFSRYARMYAPFLFFYLAASFAVLAWARTAKACFLVVAIPLVAAAATLHLTSVLITLCALVPLLIIDCTRVRPVWLILVAIAIAVAPLAWERYFVAPPYVGWVLPGPASAPNALADSGTGLPARVTIFVFMGAALGVWAAARTLLHVRPRVNGLLSAALYATAGAAGALAGAGELYGAALAGLVFLLPHPLPRRELLQRIALPALLLVLPTLAGSYVALAHAAHAPVRGGAWRTLASFPSPYGVRLARQMPGVCLLFSVGTLLLALRAPRPEDRGVRISVLIVLLSLAALGLSNRAVQTRYAFSVYPFLLLIVGATMLTLADVPRRWSRHWSAGIGLAVASLIAVSGVLGGHGLGSAWQQASLEHGQPVAERSNMFPFRPDHESAGLYVRKARTVGDIVVAEDPLVQRWYAGPIDYWFRRYGDARAYLYAAPDGRQRDQYAGSAIAPDPLVIDSVIARARGRVWFITSGETAPLHSWYLSSAQARWLDSLARARHPVLVGRDGVTGVYCLNCPTR
jgi:4-amino-4-deoxy-L-arabinose transferase-like glycosyltransferase